MIKVRASVFVQRPPGEVFAYLSNFENNPDWQGGMVSARFTSPPPLQVGSTYDQIAKFLGRAVVSSFKVIAYEPGKMVKATSTQSSFPITFTRTVEPKEEGTQVSATIEGEATGFFKLAEPLMRRLVRNSVASDYRNL